MKEQYDCVVAGVVPLGSVACTAGNSALEVVVEKLVAATTK